MAKKSGKKGVGKKAKKKKYRLAKFLFKLALIFGTMLVLFFGAIYFGLFGALPTEAELKSIQQENASLILSADNHVIGKVFAKNRTQIDSATVPQFLLDALVSTEDKRFYTHEGVDYFSYIRVFLRTIILQDKAGGGGSTITQQLIKNLMGRPNYGVLTMPISKIKEIIVATRIEEIYTKNQILVLYFNTVPFGENVWGVEAASSRYFNKHCSELDVPQAALLVGMLKANSSFNPRLYPEAAIARRNTVLQLMADAGKLSPEKADKYQAEPLQLDYTNYDLYNPSGYFVFKVRQEVNTILAEYNKANNTSYDVEKDGLQIKTTLNFAMQNMAVEAVKKQLSAKQKILAKELEGSSYKKAFYKKHATLAQDTTKKLRFVFSWDDKNQKEITKIDSAWQYQQLLHASVYVQDPKSGEILVWVGGNNFRYLPYDLVTAKRQTASAFKPIVYAAALESGFSPCDYFNNEAVVYEEFDNWEPQNYNGQGSGETAMWYALSNSLNVPTVDLFMQTGYTKVRLVAADMGLKLPVKVTPAVALGSESFSLQTLTKAYGAFANHGKIVSTKMITEITDKNGNVIYKAPRTKSTQVLTDTTAFMVSNMLLTATNQGTGRSLHSSFGVKSHIAGKTGTSQNYSDAWYLSFTQNLVCGVWVGAMSPDVHFRTGVNGSGSTLALPIAARFYKQMETTSTLRRKYLTGIDNSTALIDTFACDGWREKGFLNRFFDDVFQGKQTGIDSEENNQTENAEKKDEGFIKRTWKKVFKKK